MAKEVRITDQDYEKHIFYITAAEAQYAAWDRLGRRLTRLELGCLFKGIELGLGDTIDDLWPTFIDCAVDSASRITKYQMPKA